MSMVIVGVAVTAAVGIGSMVVSADSSRKQIHAAQDAQKSQQDLAASLKYQPIDITKLAADASSQATANATQSLALEKQLQPDVAAARSGLSSRVASELALGGNLSPDVANQVAQAARTRGSASGVGGNAAPLTAALTGQTAQGLLQQRIGNASNLMAANPLPIAGLDPGQLASAEIANTNATNQFNLAKAGVSSNLIQSGAQVQAAQAGQQAAQWNNILNLVSSMGNNSPAQPWGTALYNKFNTPNPTTTPTTTPGSLSMMDKTTFFGGS